VLRRRRSTEEAYGPCKTRVLAFEATTAAVLYLSQTSHFTFSNSSSLARKVPSILLLSRQDMLSDLNSVLKRKFRLPFLRGED